MAKNVFKYCNFVYFVNYDSKYTSFILNVCFIQFNLHSIEGKPEKQIRLRIQCLIAVPQAMSVKHHHYHNATNL